MTYGVDECRVCGARITPSGPGSMDRYLASLNLSKPTMTVKAWRAAGFKAMPTPWQMGHVRDGCCYKCQFTLGMAQIRQPIYIVPAVAFFVLAIVLFVAFGCSFT